MERTAAKTALEWPVDRIAGIGPKRVTALQNAGVYTIGDILYYFPRRYLDRSTVTPINRLKPDQEVTVVARVMQFSVQKGRRNRFVLVVGDGTGFMHCIWFARLTWWYKMFKQGEWLALSGKVGFFKGWQMIHPEFDRLGMSGEGELVHTGKIIPLYPSSEALGEAGFDSRGFRRIIHGVLKNYGEQIRESIPAALVTRLRLPPLRQALTAIHFPADFAGLQAAQARLKFDELFFMELLVALRRRHQHESTGGIRFETVGELTRRLIAALPFELTAAQKRVLRQIRADMKSPRPMNRLLQGDVGSGKTVVALITMLIAVENGYQAALMAPTEILAEQHYLTIRSMLAELGVEVALLTGGQNRGERERLLERIAAGEVRIVIGTHALIQESVDFHQLGLVVIDEQHRFGVMQRASLREKGLNPDVLVMTATPIPRTLTLTVYGDLDVSIIDELPAHRKPIRTFWREESRRGQIYQFLRSKVAEGAQAFIVFPLVEESEKSDLKAAVDSYKVMRETFFREFRLGLVHGRMPAAEKDAIMAAFKNRELQILVSTTVIEVGVDVPNASIMIVEHAERFGLTQLHQLRGRVGRGSQQSYCILISYGALTEEARTRLNTLVATNDGFRIAEVDLQLRGPGEFFGTRQHGLPELRLADPSRDMQLLRLARDEAFRLVEEDPQLLGEESLGTRHYFMKNFQERFGLAWVG
ncbi:MAG TPA: ATP-dependent DNA helicase RecG [bacterium]|nr:ATP-dependent DNA helicase RecG [bacterium]